jgi:hypothetical protein
VPAADPMDEILADLKAIRRVLEGGHDADGDHHPGLAHRVTALENALAWAKGIATAVVTAVLVALAATFGPAGPGPHPPAGHP